MARKLQMFCWPTAVLVMAFVIAALFHYSREIDAEAYIVNKLAKAEAVKSKFTPVLIYGRRGEGAVMVGSGSLFTKDGVEQIVTCEHVLSKRFGSRAVVFRTLRPFENEITHVVDSVSHKGVEVALHPGENPDVAVLNVGVAEKLVDFYSDRPRITDRPAGHIEPAVEAKTLQSLVNGERVRILGLIKIDDDGVQYTLLDYASIPGESGTGFVNADDQLYVLRGNFEVPSDQRPLIEGRLGKFRELGIAYGPMQVRK